MPRFYCPTPLIPGALLDLPAGAARHVQVLRLQPGDAITLFNGGPGWADDLSGLGGEFDALVTRMGRSDVQVQVGAHHAVEREAARAVHLAVGMPANDRMDWLVEKATELGVASIQPLMTERSVLKLTGERADKKVAHWQSVAVAACEQCGGNRVPRIHEVLSLTAWTRARLAALVTAPMTAEVAAAPTAAALAAASAPPEQALLLSLRTGTLALRDALNPGQAAGPVTFLSGPEGGLSASEEDAALSCGFVPVTLGPRVLRSETAALAALMALRV